MSITQYAGSVALQWDTVGSMDTTRWLGSRVSVSGCPVSGPGVVYSVTHDLDLGTCTINLGPAPYLSAADWVSLLAPKSSTSTISGVSGSDYATGGGGSSGGGASPEELEQLEELEDKLSGYEETLVLMAVNNGEIVEKIVLTKPHTYT